ncbi:hypothetical protein [Pseudomonas protegens]|uniref:hypothetical protein n=1 Tax=Pseudomonas protegens TaxID=380021 RepID=UPI00064272BD|nr:hypothetical protein [Pseudomonas protegens]
MFDELIFTGESPAKEDAYVGGGACLPTELPEHKGVLSDGMGYLFLDEDFSERIGAGIGRFFLQLG